MVDKLIRSLERLAAMGDAEAAVRLNRCRERAGIVTNTAATVVHFVPPEFHLFVNADGGFILDGTSLVVDREVPHVRSLCGAILWPRGIRPSRRSCLFTIDPAAVTCKSCVRSMACNKSRKKRTARRHYAPGSLCGGGAVTVCGLWDDTRFLESTSHTMKSVNCRSCARIMKKGRRRSRKP